MSKKKKTTERYNLILKDYDGNSLKNNFNENNDLYVCHWTELQPLLKEFYDQRTVTFNSIKELIDSGLKNEDIDFIRLIGYIPTINNEPTPINDHNEEYIKFNVGFLESHNINNLKKLYKTTELDVDHTIRVYLKRGVCYNGK